MDFDATVEQASTALTSAERVTTYRAVVDAYRGELAAGQRWPWLAPAPEKTRSDVLDAYITLGEASPAAEALAVLRAAMAVDPDNGPSAGNAVADARSGTARITPQLLQHLGYRSGQRSSVFVCYSRSGRLRSASNEAVEGGVAAPYRRPTSGDRRLRRRCAANEQLVSLMQQLVVGGAHD